MMMQHVSLIMMGCLSLLVAQTAIAQTPEVQPADAPIATALLEEEPAVPSLMFSETDIKNLSKVVVALRLREDPKRAATGEGASEEDILNELLLRAGQQEAELSPLPEFYVASLLYRSQNDWAVWLRVHRAAPVQKKEASKNDANSRVTEIFKNVENVLGSDKKDEPVVMGGAVDKRIILSSDAPQNEEFGIRVESISVDKVMLVYKPTETASAVARYRDRESDSPRLWKFRNRLVSGEEITYDATTKEFLATLRLNQTFSADMMRIVEGKITNAPAPVVVKAAGEQAVAPSAGSENTLSAQPVDRERQISDQLINQMQKIQKFLPQQAVDPSQQ